MHGTQGTGKGLLFHNIIRPLFGEKLAQIRTFDMLEEPYNGYMQHTLAVEFRRARPLSVDIVV